MDFELDKYDTRTLAEKGARFTPTNIMTGEPMLAKNGKPVVLILHGTDSNRYRLAARAATKARIDAAAKAAADGAEQPDEEASIAAEDASVVAVLAQSTSGWENVFTTTGEEIPFALASVTALYAKHVWLRDQVDRFISARRNFMPAS